MSAQELSEIREQLQKLQDILSNRTVTIYAYIRGTDECKEVVMKLSNTINDLMKELVPGIIYTTIWSKRTGNYYEYENETLESAGIYDGYEVEYELW